MKKFNIYIFIISFVFGLISCDKLEVANDNEPDLAKSLTLPSDVKGVAGGLVNKWFMTAHAADGLSIPTWVMADAGTCSWGNFGMKDMSSEPRVSFNNTPSYSNKAIVEKYYSGMYSALSQANDVLLQTVVGGLEIKEGDTDDTPMVNAMAYFIQGASLSHIALFFDKGFIIKEDTDLTVEIPESDFTAIANSALESFDKCIAICDANNFTLPDSWIPGDSYSNSDLKALASSFAARTIAYLPRNSQQNDAANWAKVLSYANNGVSKNFAPLADDATWYSLYQTYTVYWGWGRVDMRVANLLDPAYPSTWPSGGFSDLPDYEALTPKDKRMKTDFEYLKSNSFKPERGEYHYSCFRFSRYDQYLSTWTEPNPEMRASENNLLKAEALANTNDLAGAAALINAGTRVTRGELPPVAANKDDIMDAIHHERMVELMLTGSGLQFFEMRKKDLLQKGTLLHWPIPASQLEVMQKDFYTFGGTTGEAGVDYSNKGWK